MEIVFVRHGETPLNAARVFQHPDTPLSDRGLAQAEAAAERLRDFNIGAIVSSDMMRARQTAQALASRLSLPVVETPLLAERSFGDLRGLSRDSLDFNADEEDYAPPNGESNPQFYARVADAFAWVRKFASERDTDRVAVFTHGLVLRRLVNGHFTLGEGNGPIDQFANTAITLVHRDPPHTVSLLACAEHLSEQAGTGARGVSGM